MDADVETFEACRAELLALAYRMLGGTARAEDVVQARIRAPSAVVRIGPLVWPLALRPAS